MLVVGIGRSGTSAFTGVLSQLGFHVPQPEVQADATNPRGFGEPRWVVDFHSRIMKERRFTTFDSRPALWERNRALTGDDGVVGELASWLAEQFAGADNVIVKDPRSAWFLPLWQRAADDIGVETSFVTLLRPPAEVLSSARRWYGEWQSDTSRACGWLNVMLHTELATRGGRRDYVRYDELLVDWTSQVKRIGRRLDLPLLEGVKAGAHPDVDAFIDPTLRRETVGWDAVTVSDSVRELVDATWGRLTTLAEEPGPLPAEAAAFDELRARYIQLHDEAERIAQSTIRAARKRKPAAAPAPAPTPTSSSPMKVPSRSWNLAFRRAARRGWRALAGVSRR
jgi:hypothetical protein